MYSEIPDYKASYGTILTRSDLSLPCTCARHRAEIFQVSVEINLIIFTHATKSSAVNNKKCLHQMCRQIKPDVNSRANKSCFLSSVVIESVHFGRVMHTECTIQIHKTNSMPNNAELKIVQLPLKKMEMKMKSVQTSK